MARRFTKVNDLNFKICKFMKTKIIFGRLRAYIKPYWLPSIIRSSSADIHARYLSEMSRLIYRVDKLTQAMNQTLSHDKKITGFTYFSQPKIKRLIAAMQGDSYSQYGEDLLIKRLFEIIGISKPSYIDIGAHHPIRLSNTALLHKNGSNGINIEANPILFKAFERERPDDVNLNCGLGEKCGEMLFYVCADSTLSTFSKRQAEILKNKNIEITCSVPVNVTKFDIILREKANNCCPNFLSIDIEGMDYIVLSTIDFKKYRPDVICVEINTHDKLLRMVEIEFLLFDAGYFHFGDVGGGLEGRNAIFIDGKHIEKLNSSEHLWPHPFNSQSEREAV